MLVDAMNRDISNSEVAVDTSIFYDVILRHVTKKHLRFNTPMFYIYIIRVLRPFALKERERERASYTKKIKKTIYRILQKQDKSKYK